MCSSHVFKIKVPCFFLFFLFYAMPRCICLFMGGKQLQQIITMNMSVRLKTCEIELPFLHHQLLQQQQIQQQQQSHQYQQQQQQNAHLRASTISLQSQNQHYSSGTGVASISDLNANEMGARAVDNQYSFV